MSQNTDRRIGRRVPEFFRTEELPGIRIDPGPFIGVVKNNSDPTRSGRLQVWIPDLGSGDENNPDNWRTVSYASPFFGSTYTDPNESTNSFLTTAHTYGMWFNVPDLGNFVLCTFIAGQAHRGFWFACVPNQVGHHMVPAISSTNLVDSKHIQDPQIKKIYKPGMVLPVAEFNENDPEVSLEEFANNKKPLHEAQVKNLIRQGTDRHNLTGSRGAIYSQTQRETPSGVFGISTPGRPVKEPPPGPTSSFDERQVKSRKGGHTFVMDDGDLKGLNNLVRLRSSSGHQILMDDSERIFYIGNSDGSAWVELTGTGHVNIYSASSLNIRTGQDFNLHADQDININAGGSINMHSEFNTNIEGANQLNLVSTNRATLYGGTINVGSDGRLDISAAGGGSFTCVQPLFIKAKTIGLNSGSGPIVRRPSISKIFNHSDTRIDGNGQWQIQNNALKSISRIVPSHEPWPRREGVASMASTGATKSSESVSVSNGTISTDSADGKSISSKTDSAPAANIAPIECGETVVSTGSGGILTDSSGQPVRTGVAGELDPGPKAATGQNVSNPVNRSYLSRDDAPNPPGGIGPLSQLQVKALMTQLGYSESRFNYSITNPYGYAGKYQFGAAALTDLKYIKQDAYRQYGGNRAMNYESSWAGKNGVNSLQDWLSNRAAQESAMYDLLTLNYNTLVKSGGIKTGDDFCTVAGMLTVAHLLGAGGARTWRQTASGQDANNTSGTTYYNRGRYAIDVLARGR